MKTKVAIRLAARRLLILFIISFGLVWAGSEIAFRYLKDETDRAPQVVSIVIPAGTAALVEAGEPIPSIPEEMAFVLGDTLQVKNEDLVDHQLGPLWIPAGTSASLPLDHADKYAYTCSFQPTRYLGIDVNKPTTLGTRLTALGMATPVTTALLFVYSILIWPLHPDENSKNSDPNRQPGPYLRQK